MTRKGIITLIIFLFAINLTVAGFCDDAMKKLGRGICNILTCPLEIFRQSSDVANDDGPFAGATYGLLKGLGMTVVRLAAGVYEVATFPIAVPKDYKPILTDPEFLFDDKNW